MLGDNQQTQRGGVRLAQPNWCGARANCVVVKLSKGELGFELHVHNQLVVGTLAVCGVLFPVLNFSLFLVVGKTKEAVERLIAVEDVV